MITITNMELDGKKVFRLEALELVKNALKNDGVKATVRWN